MFSIMMRLSVDGGAEQPASRVLHGKESDASYKLANHVAPAVCFKCALPNTAGFTKVKPHHRRAASRSVPTDSSLALAIVLVPAMGMNN